MLARIVASLRMPLVIFTFFIKLHTASVHPKRVLKLSNDFRFEYILRLNEDNF